ncbi:aquaporin [Thraustotheca clavata]|uniref:Aquaporin n=1 Tax=Thraustotheca clavata TaxID=74557 RepID=A0A1V9YV98_9STRA|nr:aquaporin [Thraustotheca clavata]
MPEDENQPLTKQIDTSKYQTINDLESNTFNAWYVKYYQLRHECLAEFLGTFVLMAFINGVIAAVKLGDGNFGGWTQICIGCGLGVTFGVHASGGISGGHINPAVSFALAVYGLLPWRKLPFYIFSQVIGAFFGALFVYVIYLPALDAHDPERTWNKTGGIFACYPQSYEYPFSAFTTEMLGTAIFLLTIMSVEDPRNMPTSPVLKPLTIGASITAIGFSFGLPTGFALNPARDFGPRLFTYFAGWGPEVFTGANYYFWIPIVAPMVGGVLGTGCYKMVISRYYTKVDGEKI